MICYVFKVRSSSYKSKRDEKIKKGWNVGLVALEGAKFHLETFIDEKDPNVFYKDGKTDLSKVFKPGFWDIDIDEYEVQSERGSIYQKKIISISSHKKLEDAKCFLDL